MHARVEDVNAAISAFPELRILQFHGPLLAQAALSCPWWRVVAVGSEGDVAKAHMEHPAQPSLPALILFDSAVRPVGQAVPGGSGHRFDWQWLASYTGHLPFGLAGGIAPGMIAELKRYRPNLVDVCSGVEASPGHKDPAKVKALVQEFKAWRESTDAV